MIRIVGDLSKLPMPTVDWEGPVPEQIAKAFGPGSTFRNNVEWFESHASAIFEQHPDMQYCVAGRELFVAETRRRAIALAEAKHPGEKGFVYAPVLPRRRG